MILQQKTAPGYTAGCRLLFFYGTLLARQPLYYLYRSLSLSLFLYLSHTLRTSIITPPRINKFSIIPKIPDMPPPICPKPNRLPSKLPVRKPPPIMLAFRQNPPVDWDGLFCCTSGVVCFAGALSPKLLAGAEGL